MKKYKTLKQHSLLRVAQRYGQDLGKQDLQNMVKMIQNGESEFVCKQSNTRTHHKVTYQGTEYYIVYDKQREVPVTFLPPESDYD
jgi:hypothetical protein